MKAWIPDIRRMAKLLETELAGDPINSHEAHDLACRLAQRFPHIQGSLTQVVTRLGRQRQASSP